MSEIPEDIMQRAREAVRSSDRYLGEYDEAILQARAEPIACALLAERKDATERAAKIAEKFGAWPDPAGDGMGTRILMAVDGAQVASAIRSVGQ